MNLCNNPLEIRETAIIFDEFQRNIKESQKKVRKMSKNEILVLYLFQDWYKKNWFHQGINGNKEIEIWWISKSLTAKERVNNTAAMKKIVDLRSIFLIHLNKRKVFQLMFRYYD